MKDLLQNENFTTVLGFVAGALTAISMLPQLIKTLKLKKAEEVSVLMLVVLITGVSLWLFYGVLKKDWPIVITNATSLLINLIMMTLRIIYRPEKTSEAKT